MRSLARSLLAGILLSLAPDARADDAPLPPAPAALSAYQERYLWFRQVDVYLRQNGISSYLRTDVSPRVGRYGEPLRWSRFYERVGRPDLARRYRTHLALRNLFGWPGLAAWTASGVRVFQGALADPYLDCREAEHVDACESRIQREQDARFRDGGRLAIVGLAATTLSLAIRLHPAKLHERFRMADEHNQALRIELGLPPEG